MSGRLLCILLLLFLAACPREEHVVVARPDIILITIDTLRADSVGFAGNTRVKTPFLDRLASRGVVFTNAHAHNVVTLPSHVNILTGLYPFEHGVRDNAGFTLDAKHVTVAKLLRDSGYATGAFVAAFPLDARFGLNQGFDVYDDNYGKGAASLDFVMQERPASAVLDAATKWWRSADGKPRFMWIHLYDPHAPYRPPAPFDAEYRDAPYLGEIAATDAALASALGPIIDANPRALVVVTSDHGEALGDHGELTHGLFAYESTLKVPLIVRDGVTPHRSEAAYVRHIDIAPTLLAGARLVPPPSLKGETLLGPMQPRDTYFESLSTSLNRGWAPLTGVIHADHKYIDLPIAELYDLPKDPAEKTNVRDVQRREAEAARQLLAKLHADTQVANRNVSAEEAARLRSLGYVAGSANASSFSVADDPKNLVALDNRMHEVIAAYERNDTARALQLAKEVVAERPNMAAGRELLAFVLQQSERVGDAIANLRESVKANTASESMRVQLGLLLTESGSTKEAIATLAPLANGNNPDALNAYGIALADAGRLDDATLQFRRVLQLDANNAPALQNLGIVALRRDDVASAKDFLARALTLNPRLPLALNTMGVVYARENDFARAVEMWNRAVAVDPRQYDALFNIGIAEGRAGHRNEARAALKRFAETAPAARYASDIAAARQALKSFSLREKVTRSGG